MLEFSLNTRFIDSLGEIPTNCRVFIYGNGLRGRQFETFIAKYRSDIKVLGFLDSSTLNDFVNENADYDCIIVASVYWKEIELNLKGKQVIKYKILSDYFARILQDYWRRIDYLSENRSRLIESSSVFTLEEHKKLYKLIGDFRLAKESQDKIIEYATQNVNKLGNQYFDFIKNEKIETMIDGGVYDGASTCNFIEKFKNLKSIYGFEPLIEQKGFDYKKLIDTSSLGLFEVYTEGLWHEKDELSFHIAELSGSSIAKGPNGNFTINTISIDEFVQEKNIPKIDFIKMDIEDAELNALKGGISTIKKDRPQLAICIYHSLNQFFDIPLFLNSNLENYSFYIEHYSMGVLETILYAIPKEIES